LLAGMADHRMLSREAGEDRLHQDYRSPLFPEAPKLLNALVAAGALMACWSGAGPTLLGVTSVDVAAALREQAALAMAEANVAGRVLLLYPDRAGLIVGDAARLPALEDWPKGAGQSARSPGGTSSSRASSGSAGVFDFDENE
jgi:homoserine kinase